MPKHPAAFINNIADEGSKAEAIEWLQKTWDELCDARAQSDRFEEMLAEATGEADTMRETLRRIRLQATCESLSLWGYQSVLAEILKLCEASGVLPPPPKEVPKPKSFPKMKWPDHRGMTEEQHNEYVDSIHAQGYLASDMHP